MRLLINTTSRNWYINLKYELVQINHASDFKSDQDLYSYLTNAISNSSHIHIFDGTSTFFINCSHIVCIDSLHTQLHYN